MANRYTASILLTFVIGCAVLRQNDAFGAFDPSNNQVWNSLVNYCITLTFSSSFFHSLQTSSRDPPVYSFMRFLFLIRFRSLFTRINAETLYTKYTIVKIKENNIKIIQIKIERNKQ